MVGSHCIPVDPYYLAREVMEVGYSLQVILAGRAINDGGMLEYVVEMTVKGLNKVGKTIKGSNVLIMGLTYKEDVADIRGSLVGKLVEELGYGNDPLLPDGGI